MVECHDRCAVVKQLARRRVFAFLAVALLFELLYFIHAEHSDLTDVMNDLVV